MRVIGGSARGRKLTPFRGEAIRPTTDRVREALFSILTSRYGSFEALTVLDLFAGSGALGIEALSRGAVSACFVDRAKQAITTLRENLERCRLTDKADILHMDGTAALNGILSERHFDLIFMDPPYGRLNLTSLLEPVGRHRILNEQGLVVIETDHRDNPPEVVSGLTCSDQRKYGSTLLSFYQRTCL